MKNEKEEKCDKDLRPQLSAFGYGRNFALHRCVAVLRHPAYVTILAVQFQGNDMIRLTLYGIALHSPITCPPLGRSPINDSRSSSHFLCAPFGAEAGFAVGVALVCGLGPEALAPLAFYSC